MEIKHFSNTSFDKPEANKVIIPDFSKVQEGEVKSTSFSKADVGLSTPKIDSELLESVNQRLAQANTGVSFEVDNTTQSSVLKVVDKTTDEVIKQYPSEEALKVIRNIQNYLSSVNEKELLANQSLTGSLFNEII